MPNVRAALLGGFSLSADGTPVELPGRKARALVAYLAAARGRIDPLRV
ncbi:MAG: hypothetical protein ACREI6_09890 [Candidatus Rokuibacteriota bacterium]